MIGRLLVVSLLAGLTGACSVPAQPAASPSDAATTASARFLRYDADHSGWLDATEFTDGRYGDVRFIKAPTDAEIASMKAGFVQQFSQWDLNKDQRLTPAEFAPAETTP